MGFNQSGINEKKLAEILGLDVKNVKAALKESRVGGYVRVWCANVFENYSKVRVSTWRKSKDFDIENPTYETDFQYGYVSFLGEAHSKIKTLNLPTTDEYLNNRENEKWKSEHGGIVLQVTSCEVQIVYDYKTQKAYTNYIIYAFDIPDGNDRGNILPPKGSNKSTAKTSKVNTKKTAPIEDEDEDDLPF